MTTGEHLDPRATALIVFDMQNGGVRGGDDERTRWIAESRIVEHCVDLVAAARAAGVRVFYVRNSRRADGADQHDTITDQSIAAARANRPAAAPPVNQYDMIDELKPEPGDFIVDKIRTGGFSSTALDTLFRANKITDVVICGVRTTVASRPPSATAATSATTWFSRAMPPAASCPRTMSGCCGRSSRCSRACALSSRSGRCSPEGRMLGVPPRSLGGRRAGRVRRRGRTEPARGRAPVAAACELLLGGCG